MPAQKGGVNVIAILGAVAATVGIIATAGGFAYRNGLLMDKPAVVALAQAAVIPAELRREKGDLETQLELKMSELEALDDIETPTPAEERRKGLLEKQIDAINSRLGEIDKMMMNPGGGA